MYRTIHLLAAAAVLALMAGCAQSGTGGDRPSLRDVTIPPDFTFATTKAVTLQPASGASGEAAVFIEVALPDGRVLHRGPAPWRGTLELSVPGQHEHLDVRVSRDGAREVVRAPIVDGRAVVEVL